MKKFQFSKLIIIFETAMVFAITIWILVLTSRCVESQFDAGFPWLITLATLAWGAYGISVKHYYAKAAAENQHGGITYDMAFAAMRGESNGQNSSFNNSGSCVDDTVG